MVVVLVKRLELVRLELWLRCSKSALAPRVVAAAGLAWRLPLPASMVWAPRVMSWLALKVTPLAALMLP